MKLSTKGRYATRLMLELALHYGRGPMLLKNIAQRQEISEKYLGHLIAPLKAAGLISSARGAHGGYILARAPQVITLAEVVQAVEGKMSVVACVGSPELCGRMSTCVTRDIWSELSQKVLQVLESKSLADLVQMQKAKQKASLMYSI